MTAYHGYVWFLPVWLSKQWMDMNSFDSKQNVSCTPKQLFEVSVILEKNLLFLNFLKIIIYFYFIFCIGD